MTRNYLRSAGVMGALSLALSQGIDALDAPRAAKPKKRPTGPTEKRAKVKAARKQRHKTP